MIRLIEKVYCKIYFYFVFGCGTCLFDCVVYACSGDEQESMGFSGTGARDSWELHYMY